MGIQGLLPALKSITTPTNVKDYAGLRAAVDAYSWLHKAAFSCSKEICNGQVTSGFISYCMHRVNLLRHHGVKPILVFDGGSLPMKAEQEEKRYRARNEYLQTAHKCEASGNGAAAYENYQKAVDITPEIAFELIRVLRREHVDYIVSPYEADAQLAFLSLRGLVDVVITEDSDLVAYGCPRILFKMDKHGHGVELQYADLVRNKDLNFSSFTKKMILELCILSGCDYLPSLQGMGVKRAHNLLRKFKSYQKVIRHLRFSGVTIPKSYDECFEKAILTFSHHRVFDPRLKQIVHLTELPAEYTGGLEFLGPEIPQTLAARIAEGSVNPVTHAPFKEKTPITPDQAGDNRPAKGLQLPAQRNVLTNYFISKSDASKQQFKAPRSYQENESESRSGEHDMSSSPEGSPNGADELEDLNDPSCRRKRHKGESSEVPAFSSDLLGAESVSLCSKVDHTEAYVSIAQQSIDKFTATISSFRYQTGGHGARVSGLRPPLRELRDNSNLFHQFALRSPQTSVWRRS